MTQDRYRELARRFAAAFVSYQQGLKSVDYTLKTHIPEDQEVGAYWLSLAERVMKEMVELRSEGFQQEKGPKIQ